MTLALTILCVVVPFGTSHADVLRYHTVVLDEQNKILPWYTPYSNAYDHYIRTLWTWLTNSSNVPSNCSSCGGLPMYYLNCGHTDTCCPTTADNAINDWGEKVPNFVDFGLKHYAYTGSTTAVTVAKNLVDYALANGLTSSGANWPNWPQTAANAGDTGLNGGGPWGDNDVHVDLGADMGAAFYKMYLYYGTAAYRTAAINIADTLVAKRNASANAAVSPWPFVVNSSTGAIGNGGRANYTSNWSGALELFDLLIDGGEPNAVAYTAARSALQTWILQYPMQNGNWVDGHSDVLISGTSNKSNTGKSNMNLYILNNPSFDANWQTHVVSLLDWTETYFVNISSGDGLYNTAPRGQYYGAHIPGEQTAFDRRMGYQAARQAAEYAEAYLALGTASYKDLAYRGFNYNTYMMKSTGQSSDGPTTSVGYWFGDIYAEAPRMYFHGFKAAPEWAPPGENHILYAKSVLKNVAYTSGSVRYTAASAAGTEYLRLAFLPDTVTINGRSLPLRSDLNAEGYVVSALGGGDYSVKIRRAQSGDVYLSGNNGTIQPSAPQNLTVQ